MSDDDRPEALPPGRRDEDDEEVWAGLVASFHASPGWPEDVDAGRPADTGPYDGGASPYDADARPYDADARPYDTHPPGVSAPSPSTGAPAGPGAASPEPAVEHFEPPVPATPPPLHPVTRAAWVGTLGGPLLLLASALVGWRPPQAVVLVAVAAFVAGVVTLVARMRDEDEGPGPDDGAVV